MLAIIGRGRGGRPGWPFDWPWQTVARAEALFKVATLTRQQGMGLMGTEGPPDETVLFGSFPEGVGQSRPEGLSQSPRALLGPDEASRFAASAPKPDTRFHYRGIAADRAAAAADLLPQRSQAYAATLCWAARYAIDNSDQAKADTIYRRYVANGAYQAWARNFGRICPPPDFEGARRSGCSAHAARDADRRFGLAAHHAGGARRHRVAGCRSLVPTSPAGSSKLRLSSAHDLVVRLGRGGDAADRSRVGYVDSVAATCCFLVTLELTSPWAGRSSGCSVNSTPRLLSCS